MALPELERIKELISLGRFREAWTLYQEISQRAGSQGMTLEDQQELEALEKNIPADAQNKFSTAEAELEMLLGRERESIRLEDWEEQTARWLRAMLDASITPSNVNVYERTQRRSNNRLKDLRTQEQYEIAKEQIEALWEEARKLVEDEPRTQVDDLLVIYTRAAELGRSLQAAYPDNSRVAALAKRADEKRNHLQGEVAAMTSAAGLGNLIQAFKHTEATEDEETIAVYDVYGNFMGQMSKADALQELKSQVPIFVSEKTGDYIDKAVKLLDDYRPQQAKLELDRRLQYEDLRRYVNQLYTADREREFINLEQQIQRDIERLERAERRAEEAAEESVSTPVQAWKKYQESLSLYEGAVRSEKVRDARSEILNQMRLELQRRGEDFSSRLRDLNSLNAPEIETEAEQLVKPYSDFIAEAQQSSADLLDLAEDPNHIPPSLQARIDQYLTDANDIAAAMSSLAALVERAKNQIARIRDISSQLNEVRDKSLTDPNQAGIDLKALLGKYGSLVTQNSLYSDLQNEIDLRTNADDALRQYRDVLTSKDFRLVEATIQKASAAASQIATHSTKFHEVEQLLTYWHKFLMLDQRYSTDPETTLNEMEALEKEFKEEMFDEDLLNRIVERRQFLEAEHRKAADNSMRLQRARASLSNGQPDVAYRELIKLKPQNRKERADLEQLLPNAKTLWQEQINGELKKLRLTEPFKLTEVRSLLNDLQVLDDDAATRWGQNLKNIINAQVIRDLGDDDLQEANNLWASLLSSVSGEDLIYVRGELRSIRIRLQRAEVARLEIEIATSVNKANGKTNPDFAPDDNIIATINELSAKFVERIADAKGLERIATLHDYLQVALTHANYRIALLTTLEQRRLREGQNIVASYENSERIQTAALPDITGRLNEAGRIAAQLDRRLKETAIKPDEDPTGVREDAVALARTGARAIQVADIFQAMVADLIFQKDPGDISSFAHAAKGWQDLEKALNNNEYSKVGEWYKARLDWLKREFQRESSQLPQSGTDPARRWQYTARLMMLEPSADTTRDILKGLARDLVKRSSELTRFEQLVAEGASLDAEQDTDTGQQRSLLDRQMAVLEDRRDTANILLFVIGWFELPGSSQEDARKVQDRANNLTRSLAEFRNLTTDFYNYIERGFVYIGAQNAEGQCDALQSIPGEVDKRWLSFMSKVKKLTVENGNLSEHPDVALVKERYESFKQRVQTLVDELLSILEKLEADQFDLTDNQISAINSNAEQVELLREIGIYDKFFVIDVSNDHPCVGWDHVTDYIRKNADSLNRLYTWARPLGLPQPFVPAANINPLPTLAAHSDESTAVQVPVLVDWEKAKQSIKAAHDAGQFDEARAVLADAWDCAGCKARDDGKSRIKEALTEAQTAPIATENRRVRNSYEEAIRGAGSRRGQEILKWVRLKSMPQLEAYDAEASQIYQDLMTDLQRWDQLDNDCKNRIKEIATLQEAVRTGGKISSKIFILSKKRVMTDEQRSNGKNQQRMMDATLRQMREICPNHPKLRSFETHPAWTWLKEALKS